MSQASNSLYPGATRIDDDAQIYRDGNNVVFNRGNWSKPGSVFPMEPDPDDIAKAGSVQGAIEQMWSHMLQGSVPN